MKLHIFNPFYWLAKLILISFHATKLDPEQKWFIEQNTIKHGRVLLIAAIAQVLIIFGLTSLDDMTGVINGLIAPVMVSGTAWFAIFVWWYS